MIKNSNVDSDRILPSITEKQVSTGFHALSDPLRLQILELLQQQELCVCDLCDRLSVPQSKLSFHLKTLKEAGLVRSRQEGRWIYYSLNLAQFLALEQYLSEYRRLSAMLPTRQCADAS
jgi:ArsR family transcriptional regulator, arsenate/arsenite/antimonite-responsive transcriptional repressor